MVLRLVFSGLFLLLAADQAPAAADPQKAPMDIPFEGQIAAPDFPEDIEWLNTGRPLTLKDLRGKVVLLDFWTYCCINCMHIIPDLRKLEAKYPADLVVIGVHSAKFNNEKDTANIREAIKRYEIEHPVINDRDFKVWRSYAVRAWPSLMLINPQGRVIGGHSGEGIYDLFDQVIGETIKYFDARGLMDRKSIALTLEKSSQPPSLLSYPGKIVADEKNRRLIFSDSNHNRILVASFDGQMEAVIGSGEAGLRDGPFDAARFFRPQGVCLDPGASVIYVADTENHSIRIADLKKKEVRTLAGTGRQARQHNIEGIGVALNSPWDLLLRGNSLYVAMAGPHQLWSVDIGNARAQVFAGTGRENITDGSLKECALAQPSGITTDGRRLYFADSEVSAVRSAGLDADGSVETLIGEGLFQFGDVDGKYPKARLQHPLGVAWHDDAIYVADTYNHKIKRLNPATKELESFAGTGRRGMADGTLATAQFNEPSGLCFAGGKMYLADANNHLIRVADLKTRTVTTMVWKGLEKLAPSVASIADTGKLKLLPEQIMSPDALGLDLRISLPSGKKLNPAAESRVKARVNPTSASLVLEKEEFSMTGDVLRIPLKAKPGKSTLELRATLFYCDSGNAGLCFFEDLNLRVPVSVQAGGAPQPEIKYQVER
jgi:thiol-disulfide isomerase/thioredoxin